MLSSLGEVFNNAPATTCQSRGKSLSSHRHRYAFSCPHGQMTFPWNIAYQPPWTSFDQPEWSSQLLSWTILISSRSVKLQQQAQNRNANSGSCDIFPSSIKIGGGKCSLSQNYGLGGAPKIWNFVIGHKTRTAKLQSLIASPIVRSQIIYKKVSTNNNFNNEFNGWLRMEVQNIEGRTRTREVC